MTMSMIITSSECVLSATGTCSTPPPRSSSISTFAVADFLGLSFNSVHPRFFFSFLANWIRDYRHSWYPPGLQLLHGRNYVRQLATESTHALGEKTIADVCEALIGASLLSGGKEHRFDMAVQAVTIFVDSEDHRATTWANYRSSYTKPGYQAQPADGSEIDLANKIFDKLGYRFKYPRLLRSAFTHPSYPSAWAKVPCYQRLEFLGDALLDMVCIENLFTRFPDKDPQWLTEHKVSKPWS